MIDKPDYGLDAPGVVRNFALLSAGALLLAFFLPLRGIRPALLSVGVWFGITTAVMVWSSFVGKKRTAARLLDAIPWRGDERVLDVGCGHGMLLIAAAKRLASGRATGIDVWQSRDQARNSADATRRNSELEGVAERVEIRSADARELPFDDASFDVVVSSLAIHNIEPRAERERALAEIVRVLKPGGHLAILDIKYPGEYVQSLASRGLLLVTSWWNLLFMLPTRAFVMRRPG